MKYPEPYRARRTLLQKALAARRDSDLSNCLRNLNNILIDEGQTPHEGRTFDLMYNRSWIADTVYF